MYLICTLLSPQDMASTQEPNPVKAWEELIINIYSPLHSASGECFPYSVSERVKGHRLHPKKIVRIQYVICERRKPFSRSLTGKSKHHLPRDSASFRRVKASPLRSSSFSAPFEGSASPFIGDQGGTLAALVAF
ncbi:hypothetical protein TNCV_2128771 [Trichonephila clavipes]|nr:hypothetical protein TNCV_2128771 [Trichonephila clavipes]